MSSSFIKYRKVGILLLPGHRAPASHAPLHFWLVTAVEQHWPYPLHGVSEERIVRLAVPESSSQLRRLLLLMYPVTLRRIHQTANVFVYPPWSGNHFLLGYDKLPEPGDGLFLGRVADFTFEESLELRKKRVVTGWASTAVAKHGNAAVLKVKVLGFIGKLIAERFVEPVFERAGCVFGVAVNTSDGGLAEHSVRVHVVIGLVDVVHVRSLLSADIWETDDFCRVQVFFNPIEVGVLVFCVYGDG